MADLRYTISIEAGYIRMTRLPGYKVLGSDMAALLDNLSSACDAAGAKRVLITGADPDVQLRTEEVLELGEAIARLELRIALVERNIQQEEDAEIPGCRGERPRWWRQILRRR